MPAKKMTPGMIHLQVHGRSGNPHGFPLMFTSGQDQACDGAQDTGLYGKSRPKAACISDCQETRRSHNCS